MTVSNAPESPNYLQVRYSLAARPLTNYPAALARHLSEMFLRERRGAQLLDLGCGRGEFAQAFADLGFRVEGVDREVLPAEGVQVRILQVDFTKHRLPFGDQSVDIVFNKSVLEHVVDISSLLFECRRILRPGGLFVTLVPDWRSQWAHFYDDWTHVRPFTLTGLRECIASHGYQVVHATRFRQLPALWRYPWLGPLAAISARLPETAKRFKWVRFSKERMLLVVAEA